MFLSSVRTNNYLNVEILFATKVRYISNNSNKPNLNKSKLARNIILHHRSPSSSISLLDSVPIATTRRPLTLIFSWMLANDKHLEKYRQLWFRRGFDVLTVKTSPFDLLVPPIGGQVVARNLVKCLSELRSEYNEIVIHAFSVGGYQLGETLLEMSRGLDRDREREAMNRDIVNAIKGVVIDSMVYIEDAGSGLSRAITLNPILQPMIETSINLFLKLFHNVSVKHYNRAAVPFFNPIAGYSGLFLYSKDDVVTNVKLNEKLAQSWTQNGNNVRSKCWSESTHVLHYRDHQLEYERELDSFIKSLKLKNCSLF